ncbi:kinase-like domain-containing protein [Pavlovales sp. CCMP2436]|nr:kinase-like domain-containing protein [Pavlovales sp. CCMP2436]
MAPSASMSAMAGVVGSVTTDTDHISVVDRWMDSRGEMDRWQAPIHEVNDDDWQKNFRFSEALGSGGFGVVTRATHIKTGTDVAIKMVYDRTDDGKPSAKSESVRREIETMRRMDHPHIVSLIEVATMTAIVINKKTMLAIPNVRTIRTTNNNNNNSHRNKRFNNKKIISSI